MAKIITGLDIGSSQIKGLVVEKKKNDALAVLTAFKHPSAGFRKGVLVDAEEALKVFRDIIVDLEKFSKRAVKNIFVNINGEHIKPRFSRGIVAVSRADQEIQEDDVDRVTQASQAIKLMPNYTILHNIVSEYFVDDIGEIKNPVGMTGNRLEVAALVVEAFAPHIDNLARTLEKAGATIGGVIFNPLAASRAVLTKRQKELGVLFLDLGFSTTSLTVYEEGKVIHAKSIPVGSGYVTNDIAIGLKTSIDIAEKLKSSYGYALSKEVSRRDKIKLAEIDPSVKNDLEISRRFLSEIIEIRLEEIFDLINNELKNIGRPVQLPAGVVMAGGGVKLPGVDELAKKELKLPVQVGYPDVDMFEVLNPAHRDLLDDPEFAGAAGLVLWGNEEIEKPISVFEAVKNFLKNLIP